MPFPPLKVAWAPAHVPAWCRSPQVPAERAGLRSAAHGDSPTSVPWECWRARSRETGAQPRPPVRPCAASGQGPASGWPVTRGGEGGREPPGRTSGGLLGDVSTWVEGNLGGDAAPRAPSSLCSESAHRPRGPRRPLGAVGSALTLWGAVEGGAASPKPLLVVVAGRARPTDRPWAR